MIVPPDNPFSRSYHRYYIILDSFAVNRLNIFALVNNIFISEVICISRFTS